MADTSGPRVATGAHAAVAVIGTETMDGDVRVDDVRFPSGGIDVEAYLVRPVDDMPSDGPVAGIVWWHWLDTEAPDGNRTEFLDEAADWARRHGAVSILPQGTYPWRVPPSGADVDAAEVRAEVARFRACVDLLVGSGAAADRVAAVGHDFGAMIAMLALAEDPRPRGLVSIAATPRWGDWMLAFWSLPDDRIDYLRTLRPLDPIEVVGAIAPRPILFQHGERDFYIARMAGFGFRRAAGETSELRFYDAEHDLRVDLARTDRTAFLEHVLDLG